MPTPVTLLTNAITLISVDLANWGSTPKTLVPAQGTGTTIVYWGFLAKYIFGTTPYTSPDGNLSTSEQTQIGFPLQIGNGADGDFSTFINDGMLLATADQNHQLIGTLQYPSADPVINQLNQPIQIQLAGSGGYKTTTYNASFVGAGGLGYLVNDTGTIGSGGATYKVLTTGVGGAVASFQIVSAGAGYSTTSLTGIATAPGGAQPGIGSGFTISFPNASYVVPNGYIGGNGVLEITSFYTID